MLGIADELTRDGLVLRYRVDGTDKVSPFCRIEGVACAYAYAIIRYVYSQYCEGPATATIGNLPIFIHIAGMPIV